jgi:hypothetical protein
LAGLENDLDVGEFARRIGAKGPAGSWPVVPGIFPSVSIGDVWPLCASPERALAMAGWDTLLAAGGMYRFWLFAQAPIHVSQVIVSSRYGNNVEWYMDRANTAALPAGLVEELAEIRPKSFVFGTPVAIITCSPLSVGDRMIPLDARLAAGDSLDIYAHNFGAPAASQTAVSFFWEERARGSIEP